MKKILALAMMLCMFALPALAETVTVDIAALESGPYAITDPSKDYVITGTNNYCRGYFVFGEGEFNVTLENLTYDDFISDIDDIGVMKLSPNTTMNLTLAGENKIDADTTAIWVPGGAKLVIGGEGSLFLDSGVAFSALIGGKKYGTCGDIVINSGTLMIDCGTPSAGIGTGAEATGRGSVTINGGVVNVFTTSSYRVGIGTGAGASADFTVTINGGIVDIDMGKTTNSSVGIGVSSSYGSSDCAIEINGGADPLHVRIKANFAIDTGKVNNIGFTVNNVHCRGAADDAFIVDTVPSFPRYFEAASESHLTWEKQSNGKHLHDCTIRAEQAHTYADGTCSECGVVDFSQAAMQVVPQSVVYNGSAHEPDVVVKLGSAALKKGTDYTVSYANHTNAGQATVTAKGMGDYDGTLVSSFEIVKAEGAAGVSIAGWTYGEAANAPVPESATNGTKAVTYEYTGTDNSGAAYGPSANAPVNAGSYTVTATFAATQNYKTAIAEANFVIARAEKPVPTGLSAIYGQTLTDVKLPEGWTWVEPSASVGEAGERGHLANYAGDANYLPAAGETVMVTVGQSRTAMSAATAKTEYIYGEHVSISVTPAATGTAAFSLRRFAAPQAGEVALYNGETQITEPQTAGNGETVTFTLDTVADGLTPGSHTLTAKYTESDSMAAQEASVSFAVSFAEDTPENDAVVSGDKNEAGWHRADPTLIAPEGSTISLGFGPDAQWNDSLTLPTEEGEHTYTYYVKDESGLISEKTVTVMVDKNLPIVERIDIQTGVNGAKITAAATDACSGVLDYSLTQNTGKEKLTITNNGSGRFTIEGMLPGNSYDLTLIVRDKVGHQTAVTFTMTAAYLPQTGDDSMLGAWMALLAMAGAMMLRRRARN